MSFLKNPTHKNLDKKKQKSVLFTLSNHLKVTNFVIYLPYENKKHYHIQNWMTNIEQDKIEELESQGKFQTLTRWDIEFIAVQKTKAWESNYRSQN